MKMKDEARKHALKKLKGMLGKKLQGGISAKVVAQDPESLKAGLEKAAKIVEEKEEIFEDYDEHESEEHMHDYDDMSRDELLALLKKKK